ncbi:MAG: M56 family metallopeptidase, partial [Bacteroidota bacterium]|nr:M56 family metallopeptidase [Bacteroidota bacterium]
MFSSLQLPLLQALGYAIANSLWQLFLLWLITIVVNGIVKGSAHLRYITAVTAQITGFVWFVSTFQYYYKHCKEASLQAEQLMQQHDVVYSGSFAMNDSFINYLVKVEGVMPYLSIAYLFLLVVLLIKWVNNFRYTNQLSKTGLQPANTVWQRFVNEMADGLGIVPNVSVYLSQFAKSPLTIGYIKPIILLPLASINQLTTEQMEAVLLHELAHIKRADYLINILVSMVEIILFFNPFTRFLSKTIQKERENCCDDWVLHYNYNASMYAEALLRLAYLQKPTGFQMTAATSKKGELLQRVKRIIQPQKTFNYKHQVVALFLITGLLFSIAWLQPIETNISHKPQSNVKEIGKKIIITPLTAQVDNP